MRLPLPLNILQAAQTPQITYHILTFAKIDLLEQIPHLELHVFHQFSDVGNVRGVVVDRERGFDLSRHVAGKVHFAECRCGGGKGQNDCGGELVVRSAGLRGGLEDVDGVPGAFAFAVLWRRCININR